MDFYKLKAGDVVEITTQNTLYLIVKTSSLEEGRGRGDCLIKGHYKYCPIWTEAVIHGSTWGGSMIKSGAIEVGMRLEFFIKERREIITTSEISDYYWQVLPI